MYIINKTLSDTVRKKIDKMLSEAYENVEDGNFDDALKLYDLALQRKIQKTFRL